MNPIEALKMHGVGVGKKLVGDAQAADVRAGKTFSNAQGNDKQGTLPVRSLVAQTVTPGVNNITKQAGIYDGDITIQGDPNLVAANIVSGKSIFGVPGNGGKRWATGSGTTDAAGILTVTGLSFTPRVILAKIPAAGSSHYQLAVYAPKTDFGANQDLSIYTSTTAAAGTATVANGQFTIKTASANSVYAWEVFE